MEFGHKNVAVSFAEETQDDEKEKKNIMKNKIKINIYIIYIL